MNRSRRQFIKSSMAVAALACLPGLRRAAAASDYNPLPIPELLSADSENGAAVYRLNAQTGAMRFLPRAETATLGYNGAYLGPTIRVKKGDQVAIDVGNQLSEVTTVHWHGMVLPARMDGGPHQSIAPGQRWRSEFSINQPAATLFYHSHAHHNTGQQVYRGLAGLFIIEDDESPALGLPSEYGVDDIPVIIQDRDFADNGSLQYLSFMPERMIGKHGQTLLVNGVISPVFKAQKSLLRLRLVNASNARFYHLQFSDQRSFKVIASDGGLLQQPVTTDHLVMAPAERYEIVLDVSDRKKLMLQSTGGVGNASHGPMGMMGMDRAFDVLLIDAENAAASDRVVPASLITYPDWSQGTISGQRQLTLQMGMGMGGGMGRGMGNGRGMMGGMMGGAVMSINNQPFAMERIDFAMKKDSYEVWDISNDSPMIHPFHIHNTRFRVVGRNGHPPPAVESGFKDTIVVHPNETVRVLLPTGPYADPEHPYMYHCHILEHEDGGMMGQFVVTA